MPPSLSPTLISKLSAYSVWNLIFDSHTQFLLGRVSITFVQRWNLSIVPTVLRVFLLMYWNYNHLYYSSGINSEKYGILNIILCSHYSRFCPPFFIRCMVSYLLLWNYIFLSVYLFYFPFILLTWTLPVSSSIPKTCITFF